MQEKFHVAMKKKWDPCTHSNKDRHKLEDEN